MARGPRQDERAKKRQEVAKPATYQELQRIYGEEVWSLDQLKEKFIIVNFVHPYMEVVRKEDQQRGYVAFQEKPRIYFQFQPVLSNGVYL